MKDFYSSMNQNSEHINQDEIRRVLNSKTRRWSNRSQTVEPVFLKDEFVLPSPNYLLFSHRTCTVLMAAVCQLRPCPLNCMGYLHETFHMRIVVRRRMGVLASFIHELSASTQFRTQLAKNNIVGSPTRYTSVKFGKNRLHGYRVLVWKCRRKTDNGCLTMLYLNLIYDPSSQVS